MFYVNNKLRNNVPRLTLNMYQDWFDVNKIIRPNADIYIQCEETRDPPHKNSVFVQVEPESINGVRNFLLNNSHKFKYIITYDDVVLDTCKNAYKYIFGSVWINPEYYENIYTDRKQFKISMVCGSKLFTDGHKIRQMIYYLQNILKKQFPLIIYRSNRGLLLPDISNNELLPEDNKIHLFDTFQFSLVIENSRQKNYFTEKLIDCVITKTIPVYWGCPNVSEYFDTTGWIIFDDMDDLKCKVSALTEDHYSKHLNIIEKNYETAKLYTDFHENINRAIRKIPEW
jgi:hypothetical protein